MVNKPQALYREDAQRAFEHDRQLLLTEIHRRMEDARHSMRAFELVPRQRASHQDLNNSTNDLIALLRSRHHASQNRDFGRTYDALLEQTINSSLSTTTRRSNTSSPTPLTPSSIHYNSSSLNTHQLPRTLNASLDTGFQFQCLISTSEVGSFISHRLVQQIRPRPTLTPIPAGSQGERLRFNGLYYRALGYVTFAMKLAAPDDASKLIEVSITASVVPALSPDLFLGKEQRVDQLLPFTQ